jgi:hypothetical protein
MGHAKQTKQLKSQFPQFYRGKRLIGLPKGERSLRVVQIGVTHAFFPAAMGQAQGWLRTDVHKKKGRANQTVFNPVSKSKRPKGTL